MFAVRQGAPRGGAVSLPHRRATRRPRLRLPASGIELGYIALVAAFAAILGVAIVSLTTGTNGESVAPASAGAGTDMVTINAPTTGTSPNTGGAGRITAVAGQTAAGAGQTAGGAGMSPTLILNLGARSAATSAAGRF